MLHTRKKQTQEIASQMALRNACRAEITKRAMGEKYVGHPVKRVARLPEEIQAVPLSVAVANFTRIFKN